jgi:hypothetical protein
VALVSPQQPRLMFEHIFMAFAVALSFLGLIALIIES